MRRASIKSAIAAAGLPVISLAVFAALALASGPRNSERPGQLTAASARLGHPPLGGVTIGGPNVATTTVAIDLELARAHTLHARLVRAEIPWDFLEPDMPGQLDARALALTDRLIDRAAALGMRTVALVEGTPCWASSAPPALMRVCVPGRSGNADSWPPREPEAYGRFTALLARRYGSKLAAIEVWNEPDQANEFYFAGPDKAKRYAAVLRAAYTAIKRADPAVPVLGASIVGSNGAFLKALYAEGIKGYYDGLSVHFYNLVLGSMRSIHEVQLANGDRTPVWLNEFGWTSCWPRQRIEDEQGCVTQRVQARNLRDMIRSLAQTPWVAANIVYKLQSSHRDDFGVYNQSGTRKLSFSALRDVLTSPLGRPSRVTVRLSRRDGHLVVSGSGPVGDYMHLEAFRGRTPLYRTLFTMNRFNTYSIALPKVLGTRGLSVSVFQYWMGVARGASARA